MADALAILSRFSLNKKDAVTFTTIINALYKIVMDYDAEMIEINSLA